MPTAPQRPRRWRRWLVRWLALALLCGLLQAWLPGYALGAVTLMPLNAVLGVMVAVLVSRGPGSLPAAVLGVLGADLLARQPALATVLDAGLPALQALLAAWLVRQRADPDGLRLDQWPRLRQFVLLAAPAAAALGAVATPLMQWAAEVPAAPPMPRALLAAAAGRLVADWAGIVVVAPVLLCWLARPQQPWRPRRRLVALPLLALLAVLLPGLAELARRDEQRLQSRFERDAGARQQRLQQLLGDPVDALAAAQGMLVAAGERLSSALFERQAAGWSERIAGLRAVGWLDLSSRPGELVPGHAFTLPAPVGTAGWPGVERGALAAAAQRGLPRAAQGQQPVTEPVGGAGGPMLLLQAVPSTDGQPLHRLAFLLLDLPRQLAPALPDDDDNNLRLCIFDGGAGPDVAPQPLAGAAACGAQAAAGALRVHTGRLVLAERRLDLLVIEPATADNRLFTAVWLLGLPAAAGAAVLATLLLALTGRLHRTEGRVYERTSALEAEIDERRQADSARAQSEQRLHAVFESVNVAVALLDEHDRIAMVNPAFCAALACKPVDLLHQTLTAFRLPDADADTHIDTHTDSDTEEVRCAAALAGPDARPQRWHDADGRVRQFAACQSPLRDGAGRAAGSVLALHDMGPMLRQREAERQRDLAEAVAQRQAGHLARLADEIGSTLNAVVGIAQRLDGDPDAAARQQGLTRIRQACSQLLGRVDQAVDLSPLASGRPGVHSTPPRPDTAAQPSPATIAPAAPTATVLCIADRPADVEQVRRALAQRPALALVVAPSAADGLAGAADADLVLLALDLPDRPGIELLRALQADERHRGTPVVVLSADDRPQCIDDCFDAGAHQFLVSPLDTQALLRAVDEGLAAG